MSNHVEANQILRKMAKKLGDVDLSYEIKARSDGEFLVFYVTNPTDRFYKAITEINGTLPETNTFRDRITCQKRKKTPENRLSIEETLLLRNSLSESLTVDRYSFGDDFFIRYTPSVTDREREVVTNANHLVFGRRGAGKSSLLAYAMHRLIKQELPYAWVAMQTYARRGDIQVAVEVIHDVLAQLLETGFGDIELNTLIAEIATLRNITNDQKTQRAIERLIPRIRSSMGLISKNGAITIFLDDIHVVSQQFQPQLLGLIYSLCRGNRCFIKASGVEQFTRPWDVSKHVGLEPTNDAQILKLDHNLTIPDKSFQHIVSILDTHATYCGLPNIAFLTRPGVLERLIWVAAAVPRDAIQLFSMAIGKGLSRGEKRVTVTGVNAAASEMAEQKLRDIEKDTSEEIVGARLLLDKIKSFCINEKRKNAFLFEIKNSDPIYEDMQRLIALRLIHVLHEGTTPHEAGKRYLALLLDYGFYVGLRAATSVDQFQKEPKALVAKEVRKLPIFAPSR